MTRLIAARGGPLSQIVAEAKAAGRRSVMLAELAFLHTQLTQLQAANRAHDTADKAYALEQRFNALINKLQNLGIDANGVLQYNDTGGNKVSVGQQVSFLTANASVTNSTTQQSTGLSLPVVAGPTYYWEAACYCASVSSALLMYVTMGGPTTSQFDCLIKNEQLFQGAYTQNAALHSSFRQTSIGVNTGLGATMVTGGGYWVWLQGNAIFTAAGNLTVNSATSGAGSAFTVQKGSKLCLFMVS